MEKTDLQLIKELNSIEGSDSFNIIVNRYAKPVYLFVFRLVGNKEDTQDIVQETFIKAWKNISKFDYNLKFKSWIFSIAKNTAIDKLRKKKTINFSSLDINESDFESNIIDDELLPDEIFKKNESEKELKDALTQLSDNQRLIIHLHISEELTFDEISKVIDKPMNTIKSQYRRSISKLRDLLLHQFPTPPRI